MRMKCILILIAVFALVLLWPLIARRFVSTEVAEFVQSGLLAGFAALVAFAARALDIRRNVALTKEEFRSAVLRFHRELDRRLDDLQSRAAEIGQEMSSRGLYHSTIHATNVAIAFKDRFTKNQKAWFREVEDRRSRLLAMADAADLKNIDAELFEQYEEARFKRTTVWQDAFAWCKGRLAKIDRNLGKVFEQTVTRHTPGFDPGPPAHDGP